MKRTVQAVFLAVFAAQALVVGQGGEVQRVLSQIRAALGGEAKLAAVKSISVEGQTLRSAPDGTSAASDFEMAFELPDAVKYMKKEVLANFSGMNITRRSGFNGAGLIEEVDTPPSMGGGGMRVMRMSPGGVTPGGTATPEQIAAQKEQLILSHKREFARLMLGMLGSSTPAYPVEFVYAGQAEAPDGKADVLEVKNADGFRAKLFVDGKTHLPLMLMWTDKEPLRMMSSSGGTQVAGNGNVQVFSGSGGQAQTPEDVAKRQEEMAARLKEADAKRRMVEYRVIYADYKTIDGVRLPTRIQRMMDGLPTEEMNLDKIKVNAKLDATIFAVTRDGK